MAAAYKLGKRPARKGAISFHLADYLDLTALPRPPLVFGHHRVGTPWGMLKNDEFSCCVFAGAAHEHMVWSYEGGIPVPHFSDEGVLADYAAVTGFDPKNADSDAGTDMADAAKYRRSTGVIDAAGNRHKIDAYLSLRAGHPEDLAIAAYVFGAVGIGLQLPNYAFDQLDEGRPWVPLAKGAVAGGHYVPVIGRNSHGNFLVVTWGVIHAMTPDFYARYSDEAVAYLELGILKDGKSPEGFDEAALRRNLTALGKPK